MLSYLPLARQTEIKELLTRETVSKFFFPYAHVNKGTYKTRGTIYLFDSIIGPCGKVYRVKKHIQLQFNWPFCCFLYAELSV